MEKSDLIIACQQGTEVLKYLTEENLNEQDVKLGFTPLAHAVLCEQQDTVQTLLKEGADANIANFLKETPLHHAADNSLLQIARLLLSHKGDPNLQNSGGETPLHLAIFRMDYELAELLLSHGADPNVPNLTMGRTPLHYAVESQDVDSCIALLKHKADMNFADSEGNSPDSLASPAFLRALKKYWDMNSTEETPNRLYEFLAGLHLAQYFELLEKAGFDDLNSMISQMATPMPIDIPLLETIGFKKIGHAKRLLMKLEEPSLFPLTLGAVTPVDQSCCGVFRAGSVLSAHEIENNLFDWLTELKLEDLYDLFCDAGYEDIDMIRDHMRSRYPINENVLRDEIGIDKPGYRLRILGKLHAEMRRPLKTETQWEHTDHSQSCNKCNLF